MGMYGYGNYYVIHTYVFLRMHAGLTQEFAGLDGGAMSLGKFPPKENTTPWIGFVPRLPPSCSNIPGALSITPRRLNLIVLEI